MDLLFVPVKMVVFAECKTVLVDRCLVVTAVAIVGKIGSDFGIRIADDDIVVEHRSAEYCWRFGVSAIWVGEEID